MEKLFPRKIDRISNYYVISASFARMKQKMEWKVEKYI